MKKLITNGILNFKIMKTKDLLEKLICSELQIKVDEPKNLNAGIENAHPEYSIKKFSVSIDFIVRGNPDDITKDDVMNYFFNKFGFGK